MKTNIWSSAATNGLFLSLITIVYTLFMAAFPMESRLVAFFIGITKLIATIGLLYYFMKGVGQEEESYTYGNAFSYGFLVSFCSNIVIACYMLLHYTFIFPDAIEKSIEAAQQVISQRNLDPSALDTVMKNLPVIVSLAPFVFYTLWGLIISSILAGFAKKAEPLFSNENE